MFKYLLNERGANSLIFSIFTALGLSAAAYFINANSNQASKGIKKEISNSRSKNVISQQLSVVATEFKSIVVKDDYETLSEYTDFNCSKNEAINSQILNSTKSVDLSPNTKVTFTCLSEVQGKHSPGHIINAHYILDGKIKGNKKVFISNIDPIGFVYAVVGDKLDLNGSAVPPVKSDPIFLGDKITTLNSTYVKVKMIDDTIILIAPNSEFYFENFQMKTNEADREAIYSLNKGLIKAWFNKKSNEDLIIKTKTASMGVRGTELTISSSFDSANDMWVSTFVHLEGKIWIHDEYDQGYMLETPGEVIKAVRVDGGDDIPLDEQVTDVQMSYGKIDNIQDFLDFDIPSQSNTIIPPIDNNNNNNVNVDDDDDNNDNANANDPNAGGTPQDPGLGNQPDLTEQLVEKLEKIEEEIRGSIVVSPNDNIAAETSSITVPAQWEANNYHLPKRANWVPGSIPPGTVRPALPDPDIDTNKDIDNLPNDEEKKIYCRKFRAFGRRAKLFPPYPKCRRLREYDKKHKRGKKRLTEETERKLKNGEEVPVSASLSADFNDDEAEKMANQKALDEAKAQAEKLAREQEERRIEEEKKAEELRRELEEQAIQQAQQAALNQSLFRKKRSVKNGGIFGIDRMNGD
jgi:hypothetical protein